MPSPLGHALGGIAAGWLIAGRPPARGSGERAEAPPGDDGRAGLRAAVARALRHPSLAWSAAYFGALGMLADADFLVGRHSRQTHSVGAAAIVFLLVWWVVGRRGWTIALASAAAYSTHLLFDWVGNDTSVPIGVLLLWPFSDRFYQSNLFFFDAISRRYWLPGFWAQNLRAVAWELVVLVPLVALVAWRRVRRAAA